MNTPHQDLQEAAGHTNEPRDQASGGVLPEGAALGDG